MVMAATGVARLSRTFNPLLGAGADRVTVQAAVAGVDTTAGEHPSALIVIDGGGASASEKLAELPFRLATITATVEVPIAPACTLKVALDDPAGMAIDVGMLRFAAPDANPSATVTEVAAVDFRLTVQFATAGVIREAGVQVRLLTELAARIFRVPPLVVAVS